MATKVSIPALIQALGGKENLAQATHCATRLRVTTRDKSKDKPDEERIPMCGVPYHSAEGYIARLIAKGYKVSICEQTEEPATRARSMKPL